MLHLLSSLALTAGLYATPADSGELRREDLMAVLRKGGYTVILRHARTDYTFKEEMGAVPKDRSMQRNLTDDGFRDAALMGAVFRKYGITFSEILSSPMFRTVETAELAAGAPVTTMVLRVFPTTPEQEALVRKAPKPGTNRLLVTHHFVIETHVPGIKPGDVAESEAAVVRHTPDGKVQLVGRISLSDWQTLMNPAGHATPSPASTATVGAHGATNSAGPGAIPDTHAGHLAREYIDAFNTGDATKMRAYINASMLADPARPTDERLKSFAKLFEDHGPLSLVSVDTSEAIKVVLTMKSKKGEVVLTVKSSEAQPMKVSSVTFAVMQKHG